MRDTALRAGRQHGAVRHVPRCDPLVRRVRYLVCGAQSEDAQRIGFDEGPKPTEWVRSLEERGITVARGVCRDEAASVLRQYAEKGGVIYNSRQGG